MPRKVVALVAACGLSVLSPVPAYAEAGNGGSPPPGGGGGSFPPDRAVYARVQFGTPPSPGGADSSGCVWKPYEGQPLGEDKPQPTKVIDGELHYLMIRNCAGGVERYVWVPRASPGLLSGAGAAYIARRAPVPVVNLNPPAGLQTVNIGTWFWTSPSSFQPISVTAWVVTPDGGVAWVTTTGTPGHLVFDAGDGRPKASCDHAGVPQVVANHWQLTPAGSCRYLSYRHAAERLTARLSIEWEVTWVGNVGGGGGAAPGFTTSSTESVHVDEVQAIIID